MLKKQYLLLLFLVFLLSIFFCFCANDNEEQNETLARWTFLIWMNGDNNLEELVSHDLNELEVVGSGDDVHVIVQADRIEGFATDDGDWTGTRRYYITQDDDPNTVSSTILEDLGEIDMADPAKVSEFLLWAHREYPAENYVFIFWDHGDGWSKAHPSTLTGKEIIRGVSSDDTSNSYLSIARGDVQEALAAFVSARGPLEVIGFDACNMAAWEVAHSLREQALFLAASEAWVGWEGYVYGNVLSLLRSNPDVTPAEVAMEMSRATVEDGAENTHSATDLEMMDDVAGAIDELAGLVLDNPGLEPLLFAARDLSRGADDSYKNWYLDLRDFAAVLAGSSQSAELSQACSQVLTALDKAVLVSYGNPPYEWVGGLSIFFDLEWPGYTELYHSGAGATWSAATRWDDLLIHLSTSAHSRR